MGNCFNKLKDSELTDDEIRISYYSVLKIKITENAFDLTNDEIKIIFFGMDKRRYHRIRRRYLDLKRIIKYVKSKKKDNLTLIKLEKDDMSLRPQSCFSQNIYNYTFKHKNGEIIHFNDGY